MSKEKGTSLSRWQCGGSPEPQETLRGSHFSLKSLYMLWWNPSSPPQARVLSCQSHSAPAIHTGSAQAPPSLAPSNNNRKGSLPVTPSHCSLEPELPCDGTSVYPGSGSPRSISQMETEMMMMITANSNSVLSKSYTDQVWGRFLAYHYFPNEERIVIAHIS